MTVADLIERLEEMDPDARVYVMSQENWPFECVLRGVCRRSDFEPPDKGWGETGYSDDPGTDNSIKKAVDCFLVEGGQIRYGDKEAWNAC